MPSPLERQLRPVRTPPPPVPVDLGRVMLVGTGVWLVALVVTVVLALAGTTGWEPAAVCGAGVVIGVLGWDWARRHRPERERPDAQSTSSENPPRP